MICPVYSPKAHESKMNSGLMVVPMILLDRHIPINGISCRERGDAVRIDRIVGIVEYWGVANRGI
jgi:hypothetical protein